MDYSLLQPVVRHGLHLLAISLAAKGYLDQSSTEIFISFGVSLGSVAWFGFMKWLEYKRNQNKEEEV